MEFDEKVAVVTGAAGGIGAETVLALGARGAVVAAVDREVAPAEHPYQVDVRDSSAVDAVVKRIEHELGPISVLVNVAGVLRTGPLTTLSDADFAEVLAVNTCGVLHMSRAVARRMAPRRSGVIITVGSNVSGVVRMHMGGYAASKVAAAMLTKCLGLELADAGIRCNVVSPGSTDTPMQRSMWTSEHDAVAVVDGQPDVYKAGIPLGRLADPRDVAETVAFLASERARHITMQEIYVDGGASLRA